MNIQRFLIMIAVTGVLAACQSPPPPPVAPPVVVAAIPEPAPVSSPEPAAVVVAPVPDPDTIGVSRDGFSPLASPPNHTLLVSIHWGEPSALTEWALVFAAEGNAPVRTVRGTDAVPTVTWDGRTDTGVLAPQGTYTARLLTAGTGGEFVEKARSLPFFLDLVPASGTITVAPSPFVPGPPDVLVEAPTMVIRLDLVAGGAPWSTWRLGVLHPDGRRFRDFISEDHRDNQVVWDGRAINNAPLERGTNYRLEAEVFDVYGNRGLVTGTLVVAAPVALPPPEAEPQAALVTVTLNGTELDALLLYFAPFSADLSQVTGEQKASNDRALAELARLLNVAPGTEVTVVGHANQVLYHDPALAAAEQRETLIPLSLARAQAVVAALAAEGVGSAMKAVGVGAREPVASFSDAENRWKNRRVELQLIQ